MNHKDLLYILHGGEDSNSQRRLPVCMIKAVVTRQQPQPQIISPPGIGSSAATDPVTPPVEKLLRLLWAQSELGNNEIRTALEINDRRHVRRSYIAPALEAGLIEMTIPDKPSSSLQRYRLTDSGKRLAQQLIEPLKP